jgi:hypothetical protein
VRDPAGRCLPARAAVREVLGGERLLVVSDNNYPFSDGRWVARDRRDDTELIVVRAPLAALSGEEEP